MCSACEVRVPVRQPYEGRKRKRPEGKQLNRQNPRNRGPRPHKVLAEPAPLDPLTMTRLGRLESRLELKELQRWNVHFRRQEEEVQRRKLSFTQASV